MPQGYLASGEAYTSRYDDIIKDIPHKVKILDDSLLFNRNIEEAFYHTLDYLLQCEKNRIIFNREKFKFCQDIVQFRGLQITLSGLTPCKNFSKCYLQLPSPPKYHQCKVLVQASQPSSMGIFTKPYDAAISDLITKNTLLALSPPRCGWHESSQ